jgi:hypothetical protein
MNSRVLIVFLVAAILLTGLVPAVVFIAAALLLVTPSLLVAQCVPCEVFGARRLSLRNLPLFRAPPACGV